MNSRKKKKPNKSHALLSQQNTIKALINYKKSKLDSISLRSVLGVTSLTSITFRQLMYLLENMNQSHYFVLSYDAFMLTMHNLILPTIFKNSWLQDFEHTNALPENTESDAEHKIQCLRKEINTLKTTEFRRVIASDSLVFIALCLQLEYLQYAANLYSKCEAPLPMVCTIVYFTIMLHYLYPLFEGIKLTYRDILSNRWFEQNVFNLNESLEKKVSQLHPAFPFEVALQSLPTDCLDNSSIQINVDKSSFANFIKAAFLKHNIEFDIHSTEGKAVIVKANNDFNPHTIKEINSFLSNQLSECDLFKLIRNQIYELSDALGITVFPRLIVLNEKKYSQFYLNIPHGFQSILNENTLTELFTHSKITPIYGMFSNDACFEMHVIEPIPAKIFGKLLKEIEILRLKQIASVKTTTINHSSFQCQPEIITKPRKEQDTIITQNINASVNSKLTSTVLPRQSIKWQNTGLSFPDNKNVKAINNYIPGKFFLFFPLTKNDFGSKDAYDKFHEFSQSPSIARSGKKSQGIIFCAKENNKKSENQFVAKIKILGAFGGFRVYCEEEKAANGETLLVARKVVHRH